MVTTQGSTTSDDKPSRCGGERRRACHGGDEEDGEDHTLCSYNTHTTSIPLSTPATTTTIKNPRTLKDLEVPVYYFGDIRLELVLTVFCSCDVGMTENEFLFNGEIRLEEAMWIVE